MSLFGPWMESRVDASGDGSPESPDASSSRAFATGSPCHCGWGRLRWWTAFEKIINYTCWEETEKLSNIPPGRAIAS